MIGGDVHTLKEGSPAYERAQLQRSQVDLLDICVWPHSHSWREIVRAARNTKYDVVTAQDPLWRGLLAWRAARISGARLNIQVHVDIAALSFFRRTLAGFILRRADSARAVSERIRDALGTMQVRAPISVLPVFVDVARFSTLVRQPHERKTILWVGRFTYEKDPKRALHILKEVRAAGVDAKLVMLGAGVLEQELRAEARELPVEFPGWQDTGQYLQVADVVVSTSEHESWGASIVEALAAGVPVVAQDVGIAREAGAIVVSREKMSDAVLDVLKNDTKGKLKLPLLSADEWARKWKETL